MTPPLPILPTTVIGSYSMPEWLERAKNEYLSRRLSRRDLDEMHDAVRKAAIKDQETAGIDIALRRRGAARQHDRLLHRADARRAGRSGLEALLLRLLRQRGPVEAGDGHAGPRRGSQVSRPLLDARVEDLDFGPAHARQAHPEQALSDRGGVRARSRPGAESRAERAGARRRHASADRRAVLLRLPRGSAVGAQGDQRDGERRERARDAAHLLRQPLRQAVVRGQLSVSVPGDHGRQGAGDLDGVRAPRRRRHRAVQDSTCRSRWASA